MDKAKQILEKAESLAQQIGIKNLELYKLLLEIKEKEYYKTLGYVNFQKYVIERIVIAWTSAYYGIQVVEKARRWGLNGVLKESGYGIEALKVIFRLDDKDKVKEVLLAENKFSCKKLKRMLIVRKPIAIKSRYGLRKNGFGRDQTQGAVLEFNGKADGQLERDVMVLVRYVNGEAEREEAVMAYKHLGTILGFGDRILDLGERKVLCG
ncbi:MAG: hypothetical protein QMD05_09650 [Candidatus Brocadiaceae bacterium]|nr:hypothetical protein [Candidatus Brocadiaceae bacterium]